ncbi:hypothetical protein K2173_000219 [Erythroxylum novogranatense]|uniref:Core-2/I-branching beta-1,6-N-acetylglucosaminyltransferase family protein n=1 Tax=Erythroxylum novogranatense TaxID=1862640 RepID=A0AAV8SWJ5_9ROSI|nr:hypothetical protein K2173_000219 [Erythroxylum novogranatense]
MKSQNNNLLSSFNKPFHAHFQLFHVLSYFFLFACGLTTGVILSSYLQNTSFSLHLTKFSPSSATIKSLPTVSSSPSPSPPLSVSLENSSRVGLTEFLKVPDVKHDMNEEELLWRSSMVPMRSEYPFNRVPKVAFLFLTKGPVLMAPLWEKFFKGHEGLYSIYVHSSPYYKESEPESPVFRGRRIPSKEVKWGDVNMVEAERRLLANALLDISNQRFILLSESCIPLFNFPTVYSYLINSTETFVEVYDLNSPVGRGRYNSKMRPEITLRQWRKGSQWFEMDRELAIEVVSDEKYFNVFKRYCKGSCYADEHYIPTFVSIKHGKRNSNRSLTWVDWSKGGPHPARFVRNEIDADFLEKLRSGRKCVYNGEVTNTCFLFARKFLPTALERLLKLAPHVMHFNT